MLRHAATHCDILPYTATHCDAVHMSGGAGYYCNALFTHRNTL